MEPFVYISLPVGRYTRLIQLQPSPDRWGPLHCKVISINLDKDDESYEAISYTWGPPTFSETLVVHDETDRAYYLRITPTLSSALLRFRSAWNQRILWADAVCINQADRADKIRQIPLMSQIYRSARRVLVWLEDSRQAESELKAFTHLPKQLSRASDEIANIQARGSSERHLGGEEGQLLAANQLVATIFNVVRAVFDQRWFSRRWIIQEVVVNPDVVLHCGQEEIAWSSFTLILQDLHDFVALRLTDDRQTINSFPPLLSLIKMLQLWRLHAMRVQKDSRKNDLLSLLEHFEHYDCADPRDRIYALAGIADNVDLQSSSPGKPAVRSDVRKLVVSMDEKTSAAELYIALAGAIYSRSEHDEGLYYILSQAGSRRSRTPTAGLPELPSWVPDWSSPLHLKMLHFQSQPFSGFEGFGRQPPTDTNRFSLTAMAKVITSSLSPLDAGGPAVDQPGELQCLTTLKVTWVGPPYPGEPAASSAQWLVASARQLWQRCKLRGEMQDPENADLRDRFIQTLADALFEVRSQGLPRFPHGIFNPRTLTYYDSKSFEYYEPYDSFGSSDTPRYFAVAMRDFVGGILRTAIAGESIPDVSSDPVFCWIKAIMKGRAFFTADRNFGWNGLSSTPVVIIGIGPSDAIPGDGVLAFSRHFYGVCCPSPDCLGDMGGLNKLGNALNDLNALENMDRFDDEARDTTQPSPTRESLRPSASRIMTPSPFGPRVGPIHWKSFFDMTYLVRVVNCDSSQQNLQEGLCWTPDDADKKAIRSLEVGYELVGECRCAGSFFGSGEQESAGKNGYTCEARDDQGTRCLITWRLEDKQVAMFFASPSGNQRRGS